MFPLELKTNLLPTFHHLATSGDSANVKLRLDDIMTGLPKRQNRCFDLVHSWAKNTWCGWKCSEHGNRCVSSKCVLSLLVPPLPHKSCEKPPKFLSVGDKNIHIGKTLVSAETINPFPDFAGLQDCWRPYSNYRCFLSVLAANVTVWTWNLKCPANKPQRPSPNITLMLLPCFKMWICYCYTLPVPCH